MKSSFKEYIQIIHAVTKGSQLNVGSALFEMN
jgi:hypothetical protein